MGQTEYFLGKDQIWRFFHTKPFQGELANKTSKIKRICIFGVFFGKKFKMTELIENLVICFLYVKSLVILYIYFLLYYFIEQEAEKKEKSKEASGKWFLS